MCCDYRSEVLSEKTAGEPVVEVAVLQVGGSTRDIIIQQILTRCYINLCSHFYRGFPVFECSLKLKCV